MLHSLSTLPPTGLDLPSPLAALERLAFNLYWTWHPEVQSLFREISPEDWDSGQGPVAVLTKSKRLNSLAKDKEYVQHLNEAARTFDRYLAGADKSWFAKRKDHTISDKGPVAYFCAEYALFEGFNQYAGGLGILAGDHCKEASDLALPFVAVGLFYRRGFFRQRVDWEGRQEHEYDTFDPHTCCLQRLCKAGSKEPLTIGIELPGRTVHAAVWLQAVGRTPLILLDTDLPENEPADRPITSQLYCNGRSMRLHQETVLGVGGVRALHALNISPKVWHLNEGHSAFLLLERLRLQKGDLKTSSKVVAANSLVTIHTPVPEGNERFDAKLAASLIQPVIQGSALKIPELLKLGLGADGDSKVFDMTAFALRLTTAANGVSRLHGKTADKTWRKIFGRPVIGVTNGVHMPTWIGPRVRALLTKQARELPVDAPEGQRPDWQAAFNLKDEELWLAHKQQKKALIEFAERKLREQRARHGEGPEELQRFAEWLDPEALLIVFARRFAPYKRASLIFSEAQRAAKLFNRKGFPVQILFTGKSHPSDRTGQGLVSKVFQTSLKPKFRGRAFHLEDYDMEIGRMMAAGADVWLNNPRRPLEASGTSGMKAAANGAVNVSILDGWWDEACSDGKNGFAIGKRTVPKAVQEQDKQDAKALYEILEKRVIPLYFKRDRTGLPREWLQLMKGSIASSLYAFSTARMIRDYVDDMYEPAARRA